MTEPLNHKTELPAYKALRLVLKNHTRQHALSLGDLCSALAAVIALALGQAQRTEYDPRLNEALEATWRGWRQEVEPELLFPLCEDAESLILTGEARGLALCDALSVLLSDYDGLTVFQVMRISLRLLVDLFGSVAPELRDDLAHVCQSAWMAYEG